MSGNSPVGQVRIPDRSVVLVKVLPDLVEVVQVPTKPETSACALERLGFGSRGGILVVRPFLPDSGVRPKAIHRDGGNDNDLGADDALLLPISALVERSLEVLRHLNVVGA